MKFEWDPNKEKTNITKHGIDFTAASTAFDDNDNIIIYDVRNSIDEIRYVCIGRMAYTTTIIIYQFYPKRRCKKDNISSQSSKR